MEDLVEKKTCTECNEVKELSEFYKDRTKADGHCYKCKSCYKIYHKERKSKGRVMQEPIIQLTHFWAEKLDVEVQEIKFRKYSRALANAFSMNWILGSVGSITYRKHITKILTHKQQSCLALHEVAHLATPGVHSKEWKALMTKHMPNWKRIEKEINREVWRNKYYNKGVK